LFLKVQALDFNADIFSMKKNNFILFALSLTVVFPCFVQAQNAEIFRQEGIASWYGKEFEGRPTASGEIFDASQLTAAHPSLPFGTTLVVTNLHNNKKVTLRVNDRGPFVAARIIDVSRAAAEQLDMIITGTAPVVIESVEQVVVNTSAKEQTQTTPPIVESVGSTVVNTSDVYPATASSVIYVSQPQVIKTEQIKLIPQMNIMPNKVYRLQVGSYKVARNAVEAFDRLKNSGLSPAYERFTDSNNNEYFRVVLAGVSGNDVQSTAEKLMTAGFKEVLIREEK
jgi:rare lipoprotein A